MINKLIIGVYSVLFLMFCFTEYQPSNFFIGAMFFIIAADNFNVLLLEKEIKELEEQNGK